MESELGWGGVTRSGAIHHRVYELEHEAARAFGADRVRRVRVGVGVARQGAGVTSWGLRTGDDLVGILDDAGGFLACDQELAESYVGDGSELSPVSVCLV